MNGGFIWLYDSIVDCVLSGPCGEGGDTVVQVAIDYKNAILSGLGQATAGPVAKPEMAK